MWVVLAFFSAICLGFYDVCKKRSLVNNTVLEVLTISLLLSSAILLIPLLLSRWIPDVMNDSIFYVPKVDVKAHILIFLKSCIVLSSWVFAYIAIKYLPLSIVSPLQATRPMWTLIGAVVLFGEVLNNWQWAGIACALGSIFLFSYAGHCAIPDKSQQISKGKSERIYYLCLILAIIIGSCSGLYDKYMMQHFDHNAVQIYYTFYQTAIMGTSWCIYYFRRKRYPNSLLKASAKLSWTWAITGISVFLVLSDYVYMLALSNPLSLISVVSTIRRGGVIIPFLYGIIILHERNPWKKTACLIGIVIGLICLAIGSII